MAGAVHAVSPADKCEASKLGTAGKYDFCRLKAEAKAAKTGGTPDFSKCDAAYSTKWTQAETSAGGMCPSSGDQAGIQAFISEHADALEAALDGGTLPEGVLSCNADLATCNGNLSSCNANLATCIASPRVLKTGQTTAYGTGSDGDLQRGASRSYTDNGDGTVTDNTTGLMWEKKDQAAGGIHNFTNTYTWSGASYGFPPDFTNVMDGTITTTFLAALNGGGGFAGHTDWRIPNLNELQSILNYENANPAVDPAFNTSCGNPCTVTTCSCTSGGLSWSSTTVFGGGGADAWSVGFGYGNVLNYQKSSLLYVRAVRGGS